MVPGIAPLLGRKDRHVGRTFVRMSAHTSRHRVTVYLEEALRLVSLPGEDEGRVYYFRRLSLTGLASDAPRAMWIERLQAVALAQARYAVHAADIGSHTSDAVFFHDEDEAFEVILRAALQSDAKPAWFWRPATGISADVSRTARVTAILDRLRESRTPQSAAAIVLAALDGATPEALFAALPAFCARDWLRAIESYGTAPLEMRPARLPDDMLQLLRTAADRFGWHDDRTVWLAAQIVLSLSAPSQPPAASVQKARATVQWLASVQPQRMVRQIAPDKIRSSPVSSPHVIHFDEDVEVDAAPPPTPGISPESATAFINAELHARADEPAFRRAENLRGDRTSSAGLYFLLQALDQLGIGEALEACPALAEAGFAAHVIHALATHAGVAPDDAMLSPISTELTSNPSFILPAEILATLRTTSEVWPRGFHAPVSLDNARFMRIWTLAVRRWCWRMGAISMRDIVVRPGRVWLTRSDLDVTLSLADADIRIRRLGLDIDPGWVPWLGRFGLVVRFHYRDRGTGDDAC